MRFVLALTGLLSTVASVNAAPAPIPNPVEERSPNPSPTGIPATASAKTQLAALTVKAYVDDGKYDRDLFPHWIESGGCSTRETVLKRDGTGVTVDSDCYPTAGTWKSPYDAASWTAASDVDIDHMVPLKNAWNSGANAWTTAKRQAYANDLVRPQLWAVTDNVNQSKGDDSPDAWKPPLASFYCTYAKSWVAVKSYYDLTITSAEKTALTSMLGTC
ncbi:Uu.00g006250.m01.CDS01 [Anthostomella pinea]|uniref:Uu.00g006250.m01.CDS01 n=1 Tax=Anthostomella pinea TaxID=933095 RepID=A0AAI8YIZ1_9PEZI|nr:Uu.00g006250.m01.CDS01 [Anthostomella pinea]